MTADLKMKEHFSGILILICNMHHICEKSSFKQIKLIRENVAVFLDATMHFEIYDHLYLKVRSASFYSLQQKAGMFE